MEILYFVLLSSTEKKKGRNKFRVVNAYSFDKKLEISRNYGNKKIKKEVMSHPSRKIFSSHVQELLDEKFLILLPIRDEKSKWYSITPLGICQLIKSEKFSGVVRSSPETDCMIHVLLSFATQNVKQYESLILKKGKIFERTTNFLKDFNKTAMPRQGNMTKVLSNVNFGNNKFSFSIVNGFYDENVIVLAKVSFNHKRSDKHRSLVQNDLIRIIELNKKTRFIRDDPSYEALLIDDDQFHHYFANLILCSLIYEYAIVMFDMDRIIQHGYTKKDKNTRKKLNQEFSEYWEFLPEYFQRIIVLFSKQITKVINAQANLMADFSLTIR